MATYPRTVTFTSTSVNIRQTAAARTKRLRIHMVHTHYVRKFVKIRPR